MNNTYVFKFGPTEIKGIAIIFFNFLWFFNKIKARGKILQKSTEKLANKLTVKVNIKSIIPSFPPFYLLKKYNS